MNMFGSLLISLTECVTRRRLKMLLAFVLRNYFSYWNTYVHIHNWPLQSFRQDYGLATRTTHFMCTNFIHERRDLQFHRFRMTNFLRNFSWQFLFTLGVFVRNLLRGNRRRNLVFYLFINYNTITNYSWVTSTICSV